MMQQELFDVGKRGHMPRTPCTPAPVGSGPEGETCYRCKNYVRAYHHDTYHLKCGLMRQHWTHGPGTDIKASWKACRFWESLRNG